MFKFIYYFFLEEFIYYLCLLFKRESNFGHTKLIKHVKV